MWLWIAQVTLHTIHSRKLSTLSGALRQCNLDRSSSYFICESWNRFLVHHNKISSFILDIRRVSNQFEMNIRLPSVHSVYICSWSFLSKIQSSLQLILLKAVSIQSFFGVKRKLKRLDLVLCILINLSISSFLQL